MPAAIEEGYFHIFLSQCANIQSTTQAHIPCKIVHPAADMCPMLHHSVWGTGQDQMRVVKERLVQLLPELKVFLDVRGWASNAFQPFLRSPLSWW